MDLWINGKKGWKKKSLTHNNKILLQKQKSVLVKPVALALLIYLSEFIFVQEKRKCLTVLLKGHMHSRPNSSFSS